MGSIHEQVPSSHAHISTPPYPRTRPHFSSTSTSSTMERAQHQEPLQPRHESEDDLTMGDIAMLSTARPSIDMGRIHYPGSLEVGHATSAHRAHHLHLHHEDAPISARTIQAHSSSTGSYSGRQGAVMHPATPSFSEHHAPSNSHVSGPPSWSSFPGAARKNEEQDPSPYAHSEPSSSSSALPTSTLPAPPACHAAMQSLLSASRQILPPLPSGHPDPSPVPPAFNRNESSTSSNTLSGTSTPSGPVCVLPTPTALTPANPAPAQPQSHDAPSSIAGAAVPATAASSSSKTTAASTSTSNANTVPSHVHADGRYKRYQETQADYRPGGYARIREGDRLNHGRYEIVKKLGVGHFSVVWLAWDRE